VQAGVSQNGRIAYALHPMTPSNRRARPSQYSLAFILLITLFVALWLAGGASRADEPGQAVVRAVACSVLALAALVGVRPVFEKMRMPLLLLGAAILLLMLQLVPLPPALWEALPGRAVLLGSSIGDAGDIWRPLALVPGATLNAAFALVIPVAAFLLIAMLRANERNRLPGLVLGLVVAAMLFGLIQASGAGLIDPLVGGTPGDVAGPFANRNHFALFLAMGCLIAPVWAVLDERQAMWRCPLALGLVMLFVLTILATGSRAGLLLGTLGLALGLAIAWRGIVRRLRHLSRGKRIGLAAAVALLFIAAVLLSIISNRAISVDRAFAIDAGQDMRRRGLPTVLEMIATYFPAGSGFGGFDPLFRLNEPHELLKPTFFNHAHNDFLEVVLDGGVAGLALIVAALGWWSWASARAWYRRSGDGADRLRARLGSAVLLLLFVASAFDYPARTPLMMVMAAVAAFWLTNASALPRAVHQL
jgi:O-antigen ligase